MLQHIKTERKRIKNGQCQNILQIYKEQIRFLANGLRNVVRPVYVDFLDEKIMLPMKWFISESRYVSRRVCDVTQFFRHGYGFRKPFIYLLERYMVSNGKFNARIE